MARDKKERWQGDESIGNQPFAALSSLKKETAPQPQNHSAGADAAAPGLPRMKSARVERAHRGGKTVTIVAFHNAPDESRKSAWLKAARRELGVGGQMEAGEVVLQGDLTDRLKSWIPKEK